MEGVYFPMSNRAMTYITLEWLELHKESLLNLSNLCEAQIREIWINKGDEYIETNKLAELTYRYDAPLYQKMIFRFRHTEYEPSRLVKQVDYSNRRRIAHYFRIMEHEEYKIDELFEFFAWIKNQFGVIDIYLLNFADNYKIKGRNDISNDPLVVRWKETRAIKFYFESSREVQNRLTTKYNKECVDKYNESIRQT